MEIKTFYVRDSAGVMAFAPQIHLYNRGTLTYATGLKKGDLTSQTNPFAGDAEGNVTFGAPNGEYDMRVVITGDNPSDITRPVQFLDVRDQIAEADGLVTEAEAARDAAAASAASAAVIANLSQVQFFTNPLAKAVRVAITASAASNGIQQLSNIQNNFGTGPFSIQWIGALPDWTPAADVVLEHKHDGTNGYILWVLTTGKLRLTINGFVYDSSAATGLTDGDVGVIDVDIVPATASVAGTVVFAVNGVQLGTTLAIAVPAEKVTNGTFDSDLTGWTLALAGGTGTISWNSGKMRVVRAGGNTSGYQAISMVAGETRVFIVDAAHVSGTGGGLAAEVSLRTTASVSSTALASSNQVAGATSGTCKLSYTSPIAQTVYLHAMVIGPNGTYDFDNVTSIPSTYSVDNASPLYICGTSTTRTAAEWIAARVFNRAKSVAENLAMNKLGMLSADVGASQTPVWSSNFSAGADGLSATSNITVAGAQLGPDGLSDWLKLTAVANGAANSIRSGISFPETLGGEKCRFIGRIYHTGNATVAGIQIADGQSGGGRTATILSGGGSLVSPSGVQQEINCEFTGIGVSLRIRLVNASNSTSAVTAGDSILIKGLISYKTGCTGEWLASNAQSNTGQVLDTSGNKQHGILPAAGVTIIPQRNTFEYRNTLAWTASSTGQHICGVDQATLPTKAVLTEACLEITGTPVDGKLGDGSDDDRFCNVAQNTGLIEGINFLAFAQRTTDGTNRKLVWTPNGTFTGTIAFTIRGYVRD